MRLRLLLLLGILPIALAAQPPLSAERIDSAAIARIIEEGTTRSQVMEILGGLTDIVGPRLTWSPGYARAVEWTSTKLASWGLQDVRREGWEPLGRGWTLQRYSAMVMGQQPFVLLSYPKAWSPPLKGTAKGDLVYLDAKTDSALKHFRGKLKGRFVLIGDPVEVEAHFTPQASRTDDSTLLALSNADPSPRRRRRFERRPEQMQRAIVEFRKSEMCYEEGATAILTPSRGDGGTFFVQGASFLQHPDSPWTDRARIYQMDPEQLLPQVAVAAEHYNRLVRMLSRGEKLSLEMTLDVRLTEPDSGYNVIAEIPGADLRDELVMVGGHLDSWHSGTGTTDNGTGVATAMEAVRILTALGLKPRRTIRIGLWGGEEQGLYGSRHHVRAHFGERKDSLGAAERGRGSRGPVVLTPEGERFCAYFNNDNGTGKIRGIYLQGNEALRPIFRTWLEPFRSMGAMTITPLPTGGTDHQSFDGIGLPGFQFIQDDIEYFTRTWHSNMDLYERAQEEDLKQAATIMAAFIYNAAMRDERLPRQRVARP